MIRKPFVAGQFYSEKLDELEKSITNSFTSNFGPGSIPQSIPKNEKINKIIGVIAPHAGYMFSGPAAAWVFKEIAESKSPDLYVILGLSHNGFPSCISLEDWETPLGTVKNDTDFGRVFITNSGINQNENTHATEHSIEVELPFLQFLSKEVPDAIKENKVKFFPIIVSDDKNIRTIAEALKKTVEQTRKEIVIIASSDFTHYGINYGYFPYSDNIKENMYKLDEGAITHIKKINPHGFKDYIEETGATICGRKPIETLLFYSKLVNGTNVKVLKYYTSADIVGDYSHAVGYCAIVIS